MTPEQIAWFWSQVDMSGGPDACWPWQGGCKHDWRGNVSYGQCTVDGQVQSAHRLAETICNGPLPPKTVVMHSCDYPPCCNPAHLSRGTHQDNARDKVLKGRSGHSSLKPTDVVAIRTRYAQQGACKVVLAREYGVTQSTIYAIVTRRSWNYDGL